MICIFLEGEPPITTSQQKGISIIRSRATGKLRPMFFKKTKVADAEAWYASRIARALGGRPPAMEGPLSLSVKFIYPLTKKDKTHHQITPGSGCDIWKETRPDCSNSIKLLEDVLTAAGVWRDDAQVVSLLVLKVRGIRPGVLIKIDDAPKDTTFSRGMISDESTSQEIG